MICLDTSILIDFFRKEKKENSLFFRLTQQYRIFTVSVITEYEIFVGSNQEQQEFWENFFSRIVVLPFDSASSQVAVQIFKDLKAKNKLIEIPDILIAATAINNNLPLATTNLKHFDRIEGLELVSM
ncbi:type II toxin-antitoxin system VapC family toxin [Haliscomenobacter hydrossis]|uniref:PilT protein domain protein n=1 Tax=Haliscomenobacter hydrossis (strain ATCC 27775 / DSM 1100 / LMG 10767 / O) TaxID=760192 RepID=F4L2S8_HALH1|nr:type II toxin-antitoxin system VapC family toxin [Haliscomenobacter hydrossis]AEE48642.1 PilT protein domain protein [Haliscomenobacter hydrossis DSM 1100]